MTPLDLKRIKYSRIITDPFPEHTEYNSLETSNGPISKFFGFASVIPKPREISIWEAYRMGYEKAYKEIEDNL